MTWQARALMDVKRECVELALQQGANRRELCRRFGISPKTGYALLKRHASEGTACLVARSSRPRNSPTRTAAPLEQAAVALRRQHPSGLISAQASEAAAPWQRFEHEQPNALWQIDFKGRFETQAGRCHPLTLLDDHPRFNLSLHACARADTPSVKAQLQDVFTRYGLPVRINADNGSPWGRARLLEHGITERAHRVADPPGHPRESQRAVPPADQRQARAIAPLAHGRGAQRAQLCRPRQRCAGIPALARGLPPPAPARRAGHGHADAALRGQRQVVPIDVALHRVRRARHGGGGGLERVSITHRLFTTSQHTRYLGPRSIQTSK